MRVKEAWMFSPSPSILELLITRTPCQWSAAVESSCVLRIMRGLSLQILRLNKTWNSSRGDGCKPFSHSPTPLLCRYKFSLTVFYPAVSQFHHCLPLYVEKELLLSTIEASMWSFSRFPDYCQIALRYLVLVFFGLFLLSSLQFGGWKVKSVNYLKGSLLVDPVWYIHCNAKQLTYLLCRMIHVVYACCWISFLVVLSSLL